MNSISHGLDVYALHHRVGRGFQPNKLGLWRQKPQQIFQINCFLNLKLIIPEGSAFS